MAFHSIQFIKRILIINCIVFSTLCAHGQNKLEPLIERIALLETYLGYLKTGYDVVQGGLRAVEDLKTGEFSLHKNYFDGLSLVNDKIQDHAKVAEIIFLSIQLINESRRGRNQFTNSNALNADEINWTVMVHEKVIKEGSNSVDALLTLLTEGSFSQTDNERLLKIEALHKEMVRKLSFLKGFNIQAHELILNRVLEHTNIQKLTKLYQFK